MQWLIRSAVGGESNYEDKQSPRGSFKKGIGLDIRKDTDTLSCQQALVDETPPAGGFLGTILWFVPASDGNTYGFDDTGRIYKRDTNGVWTKVYTDTSGRITGAAERYSVGGSTFLTWATSDGRLNQKVLPGNGVVPWNDLNNIATWPKTNLVPSTWNTIRWVTGVLLVANANKVALVGYDDSYTNNALVLHPNAVAKEILERGDRAIIATSNKNNLQKALLFPWLPEIKQNFGTPKALPVKDINAMIDTEVPLLQAGSNGGIFFSDLINFQPIKIIRGGGQANPDGADILDGMAIFGIYGGTYPGIYSLGRTAKDKPFVLNLEYPIDADEIGAVKNIGTTVLVSYRKGSTKGVKKIDTAAKATAYYYSLDVLVPSNFVDPVIFDNVVLHTKPMPAGTAIEVWYRLDKRTSQYTNEAAVLSDATGWYQAKLEDNVAQFTATNETHAAFYIASLGKILEVKIVLIPNGNTSPEVKFPIEVNFTP